jgi:carbamoyl-phosphate synthase large subunit
MAGKTLDDLDIHGEIIPPYICVKEAVFPFVKFPGVDTLLGPEMKSTGEVMGIDTDFYKAFAKSQLAAGVRLPAKGTVFVSLKDEDKKAFLEPAQRLVAGGFTLVATRGTASFLRDNNLPVTSVNKVKEGRPHCVDALKSKEIDMVFNTTFGAQSVSDSYSIRRTTLMNGIAYYTTMEGIIAAVDAVLALGREKLDVVPLQEYYAEQ